MLVVTLMLLIGTTIAAMTVYALSVEIRSAGYYRQQAQTHYIAEAAMAGALSVQPATIASNMLALERGAPPVPALADPNEVSSIINYDEPDPFLVPGGGKHIYRLPQVVLESMLVGDLGAPPVLGGTGESLGVQAFAPWYIVDFTDFRVEQAAVSGQDSSGNSPQVYVVANATARGRTLLDDGAGAPAARGLRGAPTAVSTEHQMYTDGAYDLRAVVRLGPVQ